VALPQSDRHGGGTQRNSIASENFLKINRTEIIQEGSKS
jgi:hypothetical protein